MTRRAMFALARLPGWVIIRRMKMVPQSPEMARFNKALRDVMQVSSKVDLNALLSDYRKIADSNPRKRGPKPIGVASVSRSFR
jgi:hypothetical protein